MVWVFIKDFSLGIFCHERKDNHNGLYKEEVKYKAKKKKIFDKCPAWLEPRVPDALRAFVSALYASMLLYSCLCVEFSDPITKLCSL